jgi:homoserine dehydrogenase
LKAAQDLGFAETDPSLDVKGYDPKYKLTIAIAHTFGVFVKPENIINVGIQKFRLLIEIRPRKQPYHQTGCTCL